MKNYFLICATLFALSSCSTKSPEESAKEMAIEEFKKNLNDPSSFELVEWTGKTDTIFKIKNGSDAFKPADHYKKLHSDAVSKSDYKLLYASTDTLVALEHINTPFVSENGLIDELKRQKVEYASILIVLDVLKSNGKEMQYTQEHMKYRAKNALNATILSEVPLNWRQYIK